MYELGDLLFVLLVSHMELCFGKDIDLALAIQSFEDMGPQNDHSEDDWIPVFFWFLVFVFDAI